LIWTESVLYYIRKFSQFQPLTAKNHKFFLQSSARRKKESRSSGDVDWVSRKSSIQAELFFVTSLKKCDSKSL